MEIATAQLAELIAIVLELVPVARRNHVALPKNENDAALSMVKTLLNTQSTHWADWEAKWESAFAIAREAKGIACSDPHLPVGKQRLKGVLNPLASMGGASPDLHWVFKEGPLGFGQDSFPAPHHENNAYRNPVWELAKQLPAQSPEKFLISLSAIVQQYCANSIAHQKRAGDISVADFARVSGAIARALALTETKEKPIQLIAGDLSGIQSYLYDITSESAAKLLTGRSFYLELLVDAMLRRIADAVGMASRHAIYSSGGGFCLIAPHSPKRIPQLVAVIREIQQNLFESERTNLAFYATYEPFSAESLKANGGQAWKKVIGKLNERRFNKFSHLLKENYTAFFDADPDSWRYDRDSLTNELLDIDSGTNQPIFKDTSESLRVRPETYAQVRLGKRIREAKTVQVFPKTDRVTTNDGDRTFEPANLEVCYHFGAGSSLETNSEDAETLFFNGEPTAPGMQRHLAAQGQMLYGAKRSPVTIGEDGNPQIQSYSGLIGEEHAGSFSRLGVLRMDVDNLGQHLSENGHGPMSLARISATSKRLDQFFKGFVEDLAATDERFSEKIIVHYAGGDDLFAVGEWRALLAFTQEIRTHFLRWTGRNPHLGISAGMVVIEAKFPVSRAALLAGEEEDRAKSHTWMQSGVLLRKDSISFLGKPLSWQTEFPFVAQLATEMKELVQAGMGRSVLQRLLFHHQAAVEARKEGLGRKWLWPFAWDLGRHQEMSKRNPAQKNFLQKIQLMVFENRLPAGSQFESPTYQMIDLVAIAARWASMELQ